MPVHNFVKRHIYFPLLRRGYSKEKSKFIVFFLSAIIHEYWASVPLRVFAHWAFFIMLFQAPIMIIEQKIEKVMKYLIINILFLKRFLKEQILGTCISG